MQNEKVIETKECKHCKVNFEITDKDSEFYEKVSPCFASPSVEGDGGGVKKYNIPTPKLCPDCRQQRRLSFRNERKLYKNKCRASGKDVISIYSPDKPYIVYDQKEWWSDKWDALSYGMDFDFNRRFFEQFEDLMMKVPHSNLVLLGNENSEYANFVGNSKNIYMSNDILGCEDILFSDTIKYSNNCLDCSNLDNSGNCYESIFGENLINCKFVNYSKKCSSSSYLFDCENLNNCLFCVGLKDGSFKLLNKQYSKEDFEKIKVDLQRNEIYEEVKKQYFNLLSKYPRFIKNIGSENCIGNNLLNSKNSFYCFNSIEIENCKYCITAHSMQNCMDTTIHNPDCNYSYESVSGGKLTKSYFNVLCWNSSNIFYSSEIFDCKDCFGCVGIRNKSYCILNKQYTKEEYEKLVPKIIEHMIFTGEWGEFFPSLISQFGYNETLAQEYFPLTKEEIIEKGFKYKDEEEKDFTGNVYEPLDISEYNENIVGKEKANENIQKLLNGILLCKESKKPFKIIKQELDFYIKHNLPIPNLHSDIRHLNRMKLRNPRKLFDRKCDKCSKEIKSTYSQDRIELVYCEECYNKDVY